MSSSTESPGTAVPGSAPAPPALRPATPLSSSVPAPPAPDVTRQIAALTDAVNRLVQAEQTRSNAARAMNAAASDIGGDIPGGAPLAPVVNYAKLSPVQQIAIGLRDAKPVGPAYPAAVVHTPRQNGEPPDDQHAAPAAGAD